MKVGLDIDGTILENPEFFAALSQSETLEIAIITGRDIADHDETVKELDELGIKYDDIHYAEDWKDKGRLCEELGLQIIFEDQDEYISYIPLTTLVMKPRNGGNWNTTFDTWLTKPISSCAANRCDHGLSSAIKCEKCQGPYGHNQQCECKRCLGDDWKP